MCNSFVLRGIVVRMTETCYSKYVQCGNDVFFDITTAENAVIFELIVKNLFSILGELNCTHGEDSYGFRKKTRLEAEGNQVGLWELWDLIIPWM